MNITFITTDDNKIQHPFIGVEPKICFHKEIFLGAYKKSQIKNFNANWEKWTFHWQD